MTGTCLGSELIIYLHEPPVHSLETQQSGAWHLKAGQQRLVWSTGWRNEDLRLLPLVECGYRHRGGLNGIPETYLGEFFFYTNL